MDRKCEYCGSLYEDTLETCPQCGAPNEHIGHVKDALPLTIEELKEYCAAHKVPIDKMRFHIGEDYKGAKAFGIYQDGENFIVYKNKANGTRAVRYSGPDEAHAVNEIFEKMLSEFDSHRNANTKSKEYKGFLKFGEILGILMTLLIVGGAIFLVGVGIHALFTDPADGYYNYNDHYYYSQDGYWYDYDDDYGWERTDAPAEDMDSYWESYDYDSDSNIEDFSDSDYYYDSSSYDYSYDDSSDWDWDWSSGDDWDWDSGSDWDSDW